MKKVHKIILITVGILAALLIAAYFAVAYYYQGILGINTWVNGVFCTGRTVEDVNAQLVGQTAVPVITVRSADGEDVLIDLASCGYSVDYRDSLNRLKNSQNPFLWIFRLFGETRVEYSPDVDVDEELVREKWEELDCVKEEKEIPFEVRLARTDDGYQLENTMLNRLNTEKALEELERLSRQQEDGLLDLSEEQYYEDVPYTQEQEAVFALQERLEDFQKCQVTLDMGAEKISLSGTKLLDFLQKDGDGLPALDEAGGLMLDETAVEAFTQELLDEYNTYGKEREFQSTRGDLVTVPAGTYGTELDGEAELAYLTDVLSRCVAGEKTVKETHTPKYLREAYCKGADDIGDTYIEVDMTEQKMYFYLDGELLVETDIVTGNLARHNGTPQGVYYVYSKQTNRILRGRTYASHVDYWMPIYKNIGIHDASWRASFGGSIYKTDGSHGCINTPRKYMSTIYENAELGTPVVVFY